MENEVFNLLLSLPSKTPYLGLILLTVSIDPYQPNSSLIFHFPALTPSEIRSLLLQDLSSTNPNDTNDTNDINDINDINDTTDTTDTTDTQSPKELNEWIVAGVIRFFTAQTHSLTELRTLRDLAIADCHANEAKTPRRDEFDGIFDRRRRRMHETPARIPLCQHPADFHGSDGEHGRHRGDDPTSRLLRRRYLTQCQDVANRGISVFDLS